MDCITSSGIVPACLHTKFWFGKAWAAPAASHSSHYKCWSQRWSLSNNSRYLLLEGTMSVMTRCSFSFFIFQGSGVQCLYFKHSKLVWSFSLNSSTPLHCCKQSLSDTCPEAEFWSWKDRAGSIGERNAEVSQCVPPKVPVSYALKLILSTWH